MRWVRPYLVLFGIATAALGLIYAVAPDLFTDPTGFGELVAEAKTDLRATYGGFQIGLGALLVWSGLDDARHRTGLLLISVLVSAVALARAYGIVVDDAATPGMVGALTFEVTVSAVSWFALSRLGRA
jgi:hypothetical protein